MAGNARFHNKLHRANHHTTHDANIPDSGTDPIASPDSPFQGDFVLDNGTLSAAGINIVNGLSANHVSGKTTSFTLGGFTYYFTNGILTEIS